MNRWGQIGEDSRKDSSHNKQTKKVVVVGGGHWFCSARPIAA